MTMQDQEATAKKMQRLVSTVAFAFMVIASWATLRLAIMLVSALSGTSAPTLLSEATGAIFPFLLAIHLLLAMLTVFAGWALLNRRSWTRRFFAGLLILCAVYLLGFAAWEIWGETTYTGEGAGLMRSLAIGLAIIFSVLAATALRLAWAFAVSPALRKILR